MDNFAAMVIMGVGGFFIGGLVGEFNQHAWFPAAWIGLLIGLGVCAACASEAFDD